MNQPKLYIALYIWTLIINSIYRKQLPNLSILKITRLRETQKSIALSTPALFVIVRSYTLHDDSYTFHFYLTIEVFMNQNRNTGVFQMKY